MLTVIAKIAVTEAGVPKLLAGLPALVEATLAEPGCSWYEFNQSNDDPTVFWVYEKWADAAALDEHMATPHLQGFVAALDGCFAAAPEIMQLTTVA